MKISAEKLKTLCLKKGRTLTQVLQEAGVSRNAYYALVRKPSLLPKSVLTIAAELGVSPSAFLEEGDYELHKARLLVERVEAIAKEHHRADPDNIRHTLLLLEEKPIDRLRRSLLRAQPYNLH